MPRGVPNKKKLDNDAFVEQTVRYLRTKSEDAQEILLASIKKELVAGGGIGVGPKKRRSDFGKAKVKKAAAPVKAVKAAAPKAPAKRVPKKVVERKPRAPKFPEQLSTPPTEAPIS